MRLGAAHSAEGGGPLLSLTRGLGGGFELSFFIWNVMKFTGMRNVEIKLMTARHLFLPSKVVGKLLQFYFVITVGNLDDESDKSDLFIDTAML